jgi:hypothetical protein
MGELQASSSRALQLFVLKDSYRLILQMMYVCNAWGGRDICEV